MSRPPFRVVVAFCDQWADPGPDGACHDACRQALATPPELLDAQQRPIALVARYIAEVEQGGHAHYFRNLGQASAHYVPETVDGMCGLALFHAADLLTRAHARWQGLIRASRAGRLPDDAFAAFDDGYTILGMADQADHPQTMLDLFLRENAGLFIELAPPGEADARLLALGDPRLHSDGGRKAWLAVAGHASPRVRFKAAQALLTTDRAEALRIAHGVRADPHTNPWLMSKVLNLLRKAGVTLEED